MATSVFVVSRLPQTATGNLAMAVGCWPTAVALTAQYAGRQGGGDPTQEHIAETNFA